MSSCRELAAGFVRRAFVGACALMTSIAFAQPATFAGIGRAATPAEIAAWDIDVRPDFKGLPAGSGSVLAGQDVWEAKCASCHGIFGDANEVFFPLVGGTTAEDVKTGRAARLTDRGYPSRTTLMKVSTVSTLWDYINRAMPWAQPKSLSVEEVYSVTAYLLNMGGVVPEDFVLSDRNIADVQARLPNRQGMTTQHALWPGKEFGGTAKPDVQGSSCMKNCAPEPKLASFLPDHARDAHGNLARQNRLVGAQRGVDTTDEKPGAAPPAAPAKAESPLALLGRHSCTACHAVDGPLVGPSFRAVAQKYAGRSDAAGYLAGRMRAGSSGVWGAIPMPPQQLPDADIDAIAQWIATGAGK